MLSAYISDICISKKFIQAPFSDKLEGAAFLSGEAENCYFCQFILEESVKVAR